ncbi:zinc-binding dehydrogenase [Micromonospora sp. NBC_01655]|uniref:zinc-binding dehydrogenase n=1 Tax=Micromonospora sp. NBC_01655 TaxID=2975983 RepID=UPI00225493DD|nr:zinc-binding dehydrogenase [Micromonospora sp. NBC_01655]MCX4473040.1 zinc-binding dehydrogenase [Micromonospora sp. NBC_01655]
MAMSRHPQRQELARFYGATNLVEERGDEGVAKIKELTNELGAHNVIEAVGTQESMTQAIRSTRPGGHLGFVGVTHDVEHPATRPGRGGLQGDGRTPRHQGAPHRPTRLPTQLPAHLRTRQRGGQTRSLNPAGIAVACHESAPMVFLIRAARYLDTPNLGSSCAGTTRSSDGPEQTTCPAGAGKPQ